MPFTVTAFFKVNAILLCAVNFLFTFVGLFLNSLVIISLLNSQLRRKLCYFMILVLACFDLAVVVVFHPFIIIETLLSWLFNTSYRPEDVNYIMRLVFVFFDRSHNNDSGKISRYDISGFSRKIRDKDKIDSCFCVNAISIWNNVNTPFCISKQNSKNVYRIA